MDILHRPTDPAIWTGRAANEPEYWYQKVSCIPEFEDIRKSESKTIALLGYAGDEGVRRNSGRIGAAEGPMAIRKMMAPMAYHLPHQLQIEDFGDVLTRDGDMEASHQLISQKVYDFLEAGKFPLLLGGGHDLAFAHAKGIYRHLNVKQQKLGIINLDSHFDLRKTMDGMGHSGSPFFQLAQSESREHPFHYFCLGIQNAANPPSLYHTAEKYRVRWMEAEQCNLLNWPEIEMQLDQFCTPLHKIYLTLDLDGFASAYAPGVSAPSPMGFTPELIQRVLKFIAHTGKLISMDVVELNPQYDLDNQTAKLAARSIAQLLKERFK
jgi:formiminoglutamase